MDSESTITNCVSNANISINGSKSYFGGIVGDARYSIIENCSTTNNITINSDVEYMGGIAGCFATYNNKGSIKNCNSKDTITQTSVTTLKYFGGIVGSCRGTITDCYSEPQYTFVKEPENLGGIAGDANNSGNIERCESKLYLPPNKPSSHKYK